MDRKSQITDLERWPRKTSVQVETEITECAVTVLESELSRIDTYNIYVYDQPHM
jgi:hypothetical protein